MNEEAVSRKERLLALRAAKAGKDNGDSIISFRNYTPSSQSIDDIDHNAKSEAIINQVKQLEDKLHVFEQDAKNAEESRNKEADLFNLAPKKPDVSIFYKLTMMSIISSH